MDGPICYDLKVISIATGTSVKCYSRKSFPFFKAFLELSFNSLMHTHMLQRLLENFFSAQHMQLLSWLLYSTEISPIENVWDLVSRRLACDPRHAASKDEHWLRM